VLSKYPFVEEDLFEGAPAKTNYSYGMTKRMLHVASKSFREQNNRNYSTFSPSNIYGPHDLFDSENSHFVPALISKVAKTRDGETLEFWGTGTAMRQQLYVDDLCKIIPILLEKHNSESPLIVAPEENLSIKQMIETLRMVINKKFEFSFNGLLEGQIRKDGSNKNLLDIIGEFQFTKFENGVKKTYDWYLENK
jgi:GDP-L-fucose synthase